MFERFTERAREVCVLAEMCARDTGEDYISPNHLLYGLYVEGEGVAYQVLAQFTSREHLERYFDYMNMREPEGGDLPYAGATMKILERAFTSALGLGHNYVGTEHILLGLISEPAETAAYFDLAVEGDWREQIQRETIRILSGVEQDVNERVEVEADREFSDLDAYDALNDILRGFVLWRDNKVETADWDDADESFARWVEGGEAAKIL